MDILINVLAMAIIINAMLSLNAKITSWEIWAVLVGVIFLID